ncbi:MAG TPA: nickel transporter [Beijerinckiaceae bacterium]|nr:nickel transporter [Beijerinckiaceae bacterium]
MSVAVVSAAAPGSRVALRLALALSAVALVAGALALLAFLLAPAAPPPPARNPFGMGLREAAPAPGGFGATLLALQASFFQTLRGAVAALKQSGAAWPTLLGIGFAYGVFHAAGPGHGKAVIAAYVVASERALLKAIGLSLAAALVQALVAIGLVAALAAILQAGAAAMTRASAFVEIASFAAVAALGAVLTWRKAGRLVGLSALARDPRATVPAPGCDHVHLPPPEALGRMRDMAGVVLAAGLRPCAGAIVVLVFALAQGLFAAGVAATFALALGTALTTGAIAAVAVFAKRLALCLAGGRGAGGALAVSALELLAAAFVLVLGAALLGGLWSFGPGL